MTWTTELTETYDGSIEVRVYCKVDSELWDHVYYYYKADGTRQQCIDVRQVKPCAVLPVVTDLDNALRTRLEPA